MTDLTIHGATRLAGLPIDQDARSLVAAITQSVHSGGDDADGVFLIYTHVDALLSRGAFGEVDCALDLIEVYALPTVYLLALLSITEPARDKLTSRAAFARKVRSCIAKTEPGQVDDLLYGIE